MARLTIALLGPFQVTLDGTSVTGFESAKVRALLAFLAAEAGHPHSREALAELLWPELPPGAALADLRHALSSLRKTIADATARPPFMLVTPATLQFNLASDAAIDLVDFMTLLHKVESAPPAACQAALALRQGPFLAGFTLPGSPQFEEWLVVTAEQVIHLAGKALARLATDCVERDEYAQATVWTRQLLALEPWNEEVHQQLIWQLAKSGQHAAALHHYAICRRILAKELGVEPQQATQALVDRIRRDEQILAMPAYQGREAPLPAVAPASRPNKVHLPPRPPVFLGRAAAIDQVAAHLADSACRLLTVLGAGGMGKTLLAVEAARNQGDHFADGVWFIDLAPVNAPEEIAGAILRSLGLPPAGPETATSQLLAELEPRQTLLVLDNFEHLLAGAELLPPLLRGAPGLKVLVTSRARLHLAEEWLLPLGGLATPPAAAEVGSPGAAISSAEQSDLAGFPSIRLFVQRVQRLDPSFQPTCAGMEQIAEICRLLEGMPLAIELAAAWVRSLSLAEIAAAVRDRLELFTTALRDVPARHRSMHAVFDHSWRLLDADERNLLRQLAVFRGGCTLAAAAAVAGASPADLESLVDKSWLRVQEHRFTLHELMRQYCAEKLRQEHELMTGETAENVHRRHCLYFAGMTGAEEQALNWQREPMNLFSADFGNLEAAWLWALAQGELAATRQMIMSLFYFAEMTGWFGAMLPLFERAAQSLRSHLQQAGSGSNQRQETVLLLSFLQYIQYVLYQHLGWLARAQGCIDEMQTVLAAAEHDAQWQEHSFWVRWARAALLADQGDFAAAHAAARELLAYLHTHELVCYPYRAEVGTRFLQMHMHGIMSLTARLMGDYATAKAHSELGIELCDTMGERRFKASHLCDVASLFSLLGDYEQARAVAQSALALSHSFADRINAAYGELTLGEIEIEAGRYLLAGEHCQRGLQVAQETGEQRLHVCSLVALARIERMTGHVDGARRRLEDALRVCTQPEVSHTNQLAAVTLELGHVACAEHDWTRACQLYDEVLACKGCAAAEVQEARVGLAEVAWAEHDAAKARQLLTQVIEDAATAAATRHCAERLLANCG